MGAGTVQTKGGCIPWAWWHPRVAAIEGGLGEAKWNDLAVVA